MKKVEELKVGMKVFVEFDVVNNDSSDYQFYLHNQNFGGSFTQDCKYIKGNKPLKMFTIDENEIPEFNGVEMEVSDNEISWFKRTVYCKTKNGYLATTGFYKHLRPITKTFDLTNVPEHLLTDELKKYLR